MRFINGTRLDDRIVRTDWDAGFIEGRQYGRGKSGGQVSKHYPSLEYTVMLPVLIFFIYRFVMNIEQIMTEAEGAMESLCSRRLVAQFKT